MTSIVANLSFIGARPTGIATYALNILPQLFPSSQAVVSSIPLRGIGEHIRVSASLSHDNGLDGHLRRQVWTQLRLPRLCSTVRARLLFSPLPEAPVGCRCRFVVTLHDTIPLRFPEPKSPLGLYFKAVVPLILRKAEHIICNSEATASDIIRYFEVPAKKITAVLLAHDARNFNASKAVKVRAPVAPYFLFIGRHAPHKNIARLISAFARLEARDECQLRIAGSPDPRYTPTLRAQVAELGLEKRISFIDYVPYAELPALIAGSIAVVLPSLYEGFGLPVLEAMACGSAVVTSNVSSLPEVAGDAAILVDPFNTEALARAMKTLLDDDGLRADLGQAGLSRARAFSWKRAGEQTRAVLHPLL